MTAGAWFSILNTAVLPAWLLLALAPRWRWTQVLAGQVTPLLLAAAYVTVLGLHWGETPGDFNSIQGVRSLFASDWALLAGWVHYLVFDLFVGSWISRDARRLEISHVLVVPCLFLTLMFGPAGLLCYSVLRLALRRNQLRLAE